MPATETVRPAIVSARCLAFWYAMFAHVKFESALVGLVCIAVGCMNGRASAVTAEVARKCAALTAKAYRPQVPGNPAAGLGDTLDPQVKDERQRQSGGSNGAIGE